MRVSPAYFAIGVFVTIALLFAATHSASADEHERTITVNGVGASSATPDMAEVLAGALTRSPTAAKALADNNVALAQILKLVQDMDIDMRDVQTSGFSLSPIYERRTRNDGNNTKPPAIVGYQVSNNISVKVRKIKILGEFLDQLSSAGANQIRGINFGLSHRESLLNEARRRAVANARAKADLYAREAGVSLGEVVEIAEGGVAGPRAIRAEAAMMKASAAVPVAAGTLELRANVTMRFAIADAD